MVENFLAQGAAINVFARENGCWLHIVDAGVGHDFGARPGLVDRGAAFVADLAANVIGFGETGIGNTTAAAALMHKLAGIPVADCGDAGPGLSPKGVRHKRRVIEAAVQNHNNIEDPLAVLVTFGGFEIAMMVSALLQLGPRLGEGTGTALALPLLRAAANFLNEMATFGSAAISEQARTGRAARCADAASHRLRRAADAGSIMVAFWCSRPSPRSRLNGKHDALHHRAKVCCPRNGKQVPHRCMRQLSSIPLCACMGRSDGHTCQPGYRPKGGSTPTYRRASVQSCRRGRRWVVICRSNACILSFTPRAGAPS
jgi:hypothetical protein